MSDNTAVFPYQSPPAWEQRKLGELTESYSGGTPAAGESEFYGGSIPFIRSAEIAAESTELFLTEKGYESSSARMVKPGDVLYALYGATSGEVAVSRQKGAINQAILAILPRDDCDARYITAWLRKQKGYIVTTYLQSSTKRSKYSVDMISVTMGRPVSSLAAFR